MRHTAMKVTCRQIFGFDCSNDADSRKGVPFRDLVDTAPHLGGQIIPTSGFWGRE